MREAAPRFFAAGLLAIIALLAGAGVADAHSLVRASIPADGATVTTAPSSILLVFTEPPDPALSRVDLLDTAGRTVSSGPASSVPGDPLAVRVSVPSLPTGVYTVSWRAVSAVDGHVATGVLAFAVGNQAVPPTPIAPAAAAPPPSALGVTGRWGLDAGYGLLLGGAWVDLLALQDFSLAVLLLVGVGDLIALAGALLVAEAARENAAVDWSVFLGTSLARGMAFVVVPLAVAGVTVLIAWRLSGRARQLALGLCAVLSLGAMFGNAFVSHAAASRYPLLMVTTHWLHVTSYAVWIGGLAAVLVGIRGQPTTAKAAAVGRFSLVAGVAFAAMIVTGSVRAIDEVGSLQNLFTTTFGWILIGKTLLFLGIAPLAATNRWRYVRLGVAGIPHLRWISRGEILLAIVVMVGAAFLTTLPPPSFVTVAAARQYPHLSAQADDSQRAVHVKLDVSPGRPGLNRFTVTVSDRAGNPVTGARLYLLFDLPAEPAFGETDLELREVGGGVYSAPGSRLSVAGQWTITAVVETATNSFDVVLPVHVGAPGATGAVPDARLEGRSA